MRKIENGYYKFGDKNDTKLKILKKGIIVSRETFLTKKTIKLFPSVINKVTVKSNSIWKRKFRNVTNVEKILTNAGVSILQTKQDIETLNKLLMCSVMVKEIEREFQNNLEENQEWTTLAVINRLFSIMFL